MIAKTASRTLIAAVATTACSSALLAAAGAAPAGAPPKETGVWYDDSGKGAVKVELCGPKLCGKIYWLKNPLNAEGKPLFDKHNPNESQRNRAICGLPIFGEVAKMPDGTWDSGWIYDPKDGKSYSVAMQLSDDNTLVLTGYLVMKLMGQNITWKRAPADLPGCAQNAAAPAPDAPAAAAQAPAGGTAKPAAGGAAKVGAPKGEQLPWATTATPARPAAKPAAATQAQPATK